MQCLMFLISPLNRSESFGGDHTWKRVIKQEPGLDGGKLRSNEEVFP